jgi:cyclohexanone monooxygenase
VLLDTDGQGVERITEKGVVVQGREYEVDCIIYATGFETVGRDGITLSEYWADGMRSKHGINVHNFPNAFWVMPSQGANLISNVPHNIVESAMAIAMMVRHAVDAGAKTVEVSEQAQKDWVDLLMTGPGMMLGSPDCTPGYYNNEGQPLPDAAQYNRGYPAGATAYFRYIREWRESGDFAGIEFH